MGVVEGHRTTPTGQKRRSTLPGNGIGSAPASGADFAEIGPAEQVPDIPGQGRPKSPHPSGV